VIVQGATGRVARDDTERAIRYGTRIVAGVAPGRGGERVGAVPIYDTVRGAVAEHPADASMIYTPASAVRAAVLEALEAGIGTLLVTAEYVPMHDVAYVVAAARAAGARLIGCNTNGIISAGKGRLGGIGGDDPGAIYVPGRIGVCSRSGGMSAEIALALAAAGFGVSTCVSMGGDYATGMRMVEYLALFEADPETDAVVLFGEPGTPNEAEVAHAVQSGRIRKPVVAIIAGAFQERYPQGRTFGHAAAMIASDDDRATSKRAWLAAAGVKVVLRIEEVPATLRAAGVAPDRLPSRPPSNVSKG
jgi:succinyl-CoA synthetase alpha subunit